MSDLISKSRLLEAMESEQLRLMGEHQSVTGYHKRYVTGKYEGIAWVERGIRSGQFDVDGWISVKERLPEIGDTVLVYYRRGDYRGADIMRYIGRWLTVDPLVEVTHWMPLPEPPKQETSVYGIDCRDGRCEF